MVKNKGVRGLISIGEVAKQLNISEGMLREWEKKGFLGNVAQIDNKRMYDEEQLERIRFINQEIQEQRKKGWQRTNYRLIEDAMTDKFGGEIRESPRTPEEVLSSFMQRIDNRDKQVQGALDSIQFVLQSLAATLEMPKELPDMSKQNELLQFIYASVQKTEEKLPDTTKQDEKLQSIERMVRQSSEKEVDLEKKYDSLKQEYAVISANLEKLADVHERLIEKLDKVQEENKELRKTKRKLEIELEKEKNRKWWQRR